MVQTSKNFSICVIFYQEGLALLGTLKALAIAQETFSAQIGSQTEYIFVDNNNNDEDRLIIQDFCRNLDWNVKILNCPSNNLARARNLALYNSSYETLIFLDADCRPHKDWLVNFHSVYTELDSGTFAGVGGENEPPHMPNVFLYDCIRNLKKFPLLHLGSAQVLEIKLRARVNHVPTCNVLYLKRALIEIGGFCEAFDRVGEDLELSMRLGQHGKDLYVSNGLKVEHHDKKDLRRWLQKAFRYGRIQPSILFRYPLQAGGLRWMPFIFVSMILTGFYFLGLKYLAAVAIVSILLAFMTSEFKRPWKFQFHWWFFLNGTAIFYSLGYIFGIGNIFWKSPTGKNAKT